jgi:fucose 4-O-acetylase-like acetyltransferase
MKVTNTKSRNIYFDLLKGIAIILVAYGHVLQTFNSDWESSSIGKTIYAFHMPLFMLISRYFFYPSVQKTDMTHFIKKRFIHLYLPSLIWGLFSCFLIGGGKLFSSQHLDFKYFIDLILTGAWYLTLLFILQITGAVIERFYSKYKYIAWGCVYLMIYVAPQLWMMRELKYLMPFFVTAIALRKYDWSKCSYKIGVLFLLIFIATMKVYTFEHSMYRMPDSIFTTDYHSSAFIRFIAGLSGSICIIWLTSYLQNIKNITILIAKIGIITLPVYVLHQKLLIINGILHISTNNLITLICFTAIDIFLSVMIYKFLNKNKTLSLLLFGE